MLLWFAHALAVLLETLPDISKDAGKCGPTPKLQRQMERINQPEGAAEVRDQDA